MSDERQASAIDRLVGAIGFTQMQVATTCAEGHDLTPPRSLLDALDEVRRYIATLEADRARLDWMAENPYAVQPETAVDSSWNTDGFHDEQDGWAAVDKCLWFADLREALDSAMSSSPLAPTQEGA